MTHLNNEELEDILQGRTAAGEHVAQCRLCRDRLAERRVIRSRLRSAFDAVHASEELTERIRSQISRPILRKPTSIHSGSDRTVRLYRWALPLTAAAAVFLIGITVFLVLTKPESAMAAPAELFQLHQHNLSPHTELYSDADPKALAGFLKDELGFKPAFPRLDAGMSLRGCCVSHFRRKPVGSYVVDTPRGVISVIVVTESPESLGMMDTLRRDGHTYMAGSFAKCNMVTLQLRGYTYCAVGEVPHELLIDLLERLVW